MSRHQSPSPRYCPHEVWGEGGGRGGQRSEEYRSITKLPSRNNDQGISDDGCEQTINKFARKKKWKRFQAQRRQQTVHFIIKNVQFSSGPYLIWMESDGLSIFQFHVPTFIAVYLSMFQGQLSNISLLSLGTEKGSTNVPPASH